MKLDTETVSLIHDEFGKEEFSIANASYNLTEVEQDLWEFTICFETEESIIRVPQLEEAISDPKPHFEATALLNASSIELFDGKVIEQTESWDYDREENLSNVYYFEHANLENLKVEILKYTDEFIKVLVSGRTLINGSNGNNPDATIETTPLTLKKDKTLERSVE